MKIWWKFGDCFLCWCLCWLAKLFIFLLFCAVVGSLLVKQVSCHWLSFFEQYPCFQNQTTSMWERMNPYVAIKTNNVDCEAGGACNLFRGDVCSLIFNFSHAFLGSYVSLTRGEWPCMPILYWHTACTLNAHTLLLGYTTQWMHRYVFDCFFQIKWHTP